MCPEFWVHIKKLNLQIQNWNQIESDKNYNHYDYRYESIASSRTYPIPILSSYIKLETALMSYAFPTETALIGNYIYDALSAEEPDLIELYELKPFHMQVQSLSRTLIDKCFAVCDYYMLRKPWRNARHLYDIYKIAPHVTIDNKFRQLVNEVREHRKNMGSNIAPSARLSINDFSNIVTEILQTDYYKSDYSDTTVKLISEDISYKTVSEFYKNLIDHIL